MVSNSEIIRFLKDKSSGSGFIDTLKIRYRPLVCPFPELLQYTKDGMHVGDVGCGSGQFALMVATFCKPQSIRGVEISERLVANARKLFDESGVKIPYHFSYYNGIDFPAEMSSCDLLYMIDVLHHVPGKAQQDFLDSLCKSMRKGATLILKDINAGSPLVVFNKMHDLVFSREIGKERSESVAVEMAQKAGFRLLSKFTKRTLVYPHYFLVLEKA